MSFQLSPGINIKERDLTTIVPAVATSICATAGEFAWGPCIEPTLITNQKELIASFGYPNGLGALSGNIARSWWSASNYLAYGNKLYVTRAINAATAKNAGLECVDDTTGGAPTVFAEYIPNDTAAEDFTYSPTAGGEPKIVIFAKYPGAEGNKLKIAIGSLTGWATDVIITGVTFNSTYGFTPTQMATGNTTAAVDWIGITVLDEDDNILENNMVCLDTSAKDYNGSSMYITNWLMQNSKYILGYEDSTNVTEIDPFEATLLLGGVDGSTVAGDFTTAYELYSNDEEIDVNMIIDCHCGVEADVTTIQQYIIDNICDTRKDCVGILTVPFADVVGADAPGTKATNTTAYKVTLGRSSSYAAIYGNWKYQYDRFNDVYRWLPLSGDIAGIFAFTDDTRDAWFAPAGLNRGKVRNATKLAFTPNRGHRDIMYSGQVNPVVNFAGDGPVVWGQKTLQTLPSAFDRIDVRRLFIVLEKAIATASRAFLFEKNTAFTRGQIKGMIEPFLRTVQGRQGIYDFHVECSELNNPGEVIDRNELVCSIFIRPSRSVEYLSLNFIATPTGVSFDEYVGKISY